jgi:hypothetical protein
MIALAPFHAEVCQHASGSAVGAVQVGERSRKQAVLARKQMLAGIGAIGKRRKCAGEALERAEEDSHDRWGEGSTIHAKRSGLNSPFFGQLGEFSEGNMARVVYSNRLLAC